MMSNGSANGEERTNADTRRDFCASGRAAAFEALGHAEFDVLVVGGGVTGAGVARDAAMRGLKVALVEKGDFGSGTSSKSSKLVHGGLRYLEQYQFGLVIEATAERARLMGHAPHLARPLPFLLPIYQGSAHSPLKIQMGLWLYDALALFRNYRRHRRISPTEIAALEPHLQRHELRAAMLYFDCMTDDARLALENCRDAHRFGAETLSYARFDEPLREAGQSRITGGRIRCELTGATVDCRARVVVRAAGPWTDAIGLDRSDDGDKPLLRPTKGVHAVVPRARLPLEHAVVMSAKRDGRVIFALPWEQSTVLGTTDTDYDGDLDRLQPTADDIDYLLETATAFFPECPLTPNDVVSTWTGLRPLVRDDSDNPYATSREHIVVADEHGVVTVAGGKLTTFRKMAHDVVEATLKLLPKESRASTRRSQTARTPLPSGEGLDLEKEIAIATEALSDHWQIDAGTLATQWVKTYGRYWPEVRKRCDAAERGREPVSTGMPVLWGELDYAMDAEMTIGVADWMTRRTHLFYHLPDQGLAAAPMVAERMGQHLGWTGERRQAEVDAYAKDVADSRAWMEPSVRPKGSHSSAAPSPGGPTEAHP